LAYISPDSQAVSSIRHNAELLLAQSQKLADSSDKKLFDDFREAQQNTANMLSACLAGVFTAIPKKSITEEDRQGIKTLIDQNQ
jgi:hypothetical protein